MAALAPGANAEALLGQIADLGSQAVWLLDVDDTLVDTIRMHSAAAPAVAQALEPFCRAPDAEAIAERFGAIFQILARHRQMKPRDRDEDAEYHELQERVDACQSDIRAAWGVTKPFSREVLLRLAAEDCAVHLTAEAIQLGADSYWMHLQENTIWFEDARQLVRLVSGMKCPIYLMTSSDARFSPSDDSEQFTYDPVVSRNFKEKRLTRLRRDGLEYRKSVIGDPIDKPAPEFFQSVFEAIDADWGAPVDRARIVVIGDSYRADLEVPVRHHNCGAALLYVQGKEGAQMEEPGVASLGDLRRVTAVLRAQS